MLTHPLLDRLQHLRFLGMLDALEDDGELSPALRERLEDMDARRFAASLIGGMRNQGGYTSTETHLYDLAPVPNYFFQRDPQFVARTIDLNDGFDILNRIDMLCLDHNHRLLIGSFHVVGKIQSVTMRPSKADAAASQRRIPAPVDNLCGGFSHKYPQELRFKTRHYPMDPRRGQTGYSPRSGSR